jgi:glutathione S-transferase
MKLYSIHNSNNCRRVTATAAHLGVELEIIEPNMGSGELKQADYLAKNPNGKVPTLEDGDFKLWESRAIMQYVASKKPGTSFWPDDAKKRADIARWQFWETAHLSKGTGPFAYEKLFKKIFMKKDPDPAALEAAEKDFHAVAPVLNAHLETRKFLLGDDVTLADFSVGACFSFAEASGLPWDAYPHIKKWWGRLNELPAWKASAPKL